MKRILLTAVVFLLSLNCVAQPQNSEPILIKTIGTAEIYYYKEKDKTRVQVRIYLEGKQEDIGTQKNTLSMDVIFETNGQKVIKPQKVSIAFSAYSPRESKLTNDHDLHLYIEGMEGKNGSTWGTKLLSTRQLPSGGKLEIFLSSPIEFDRIAKMANAMVARVALGRDTYAMKKEGLQALKDFTKTIEN